MLLNQFGNEVVAANYNDLTEDQQDQIRKDYASSKRTAEFDEWGGLNYGVDPGSLGHLSWKMLRYLYSCSSAIRPSVDSICREVSNLQWKVIKSDYKYHDPKELKPIVYFLKHPNLDGEKFPSLISKFIHDLLVVGKGVIEKVRNPYGDLKELVARDASLYTPRVNKYGFIVDIIEYKKDTTTVAAYHKKENIIFEYFTPVSYTFGAIPIIETIINEIALLMLSVKSIAWSFTRDEIPPGILHLGQIGDIALQRAKASFEAAKGIAAQHKMRVVDNVDNVKWVQFTRTHQEMQVAELIPMIERIIFRNFGLSPVESSQVDISRQVADVSFKSSQSKMVSPVMNLVSEALNNDVVEELIDDTIFMFSRNPQESFNEQSKGLMDLQDRGTITVNEARLKLGLDPVKGGDIRGYRLGNEVAMIDEKTGELQYREEPAPKPSKGTTGKPNKNE